MEGADILESEATTVAGTFASRDEEDVVPTARAAAVAEADDEAAGPDLADVARNEAEVECDDGIGALGNVAGGTAGIFDAT